MLNMAHIQQPWKSNIIFIHHQSQPQVSGCAVESTVGKALVVQLRTYCYCTAHHVQVHTIPTWKMHSLILNLTNACC